MSCTLAACGGVQAGERASVPWREYVALDAAGDPAVLIAAGDPVLSASARPPDALVALALESASDVVAAVEAANREAMFDLETWGDNVDTDPVTEAWLRVDEAQVLARLTIQPRPQPQPVSVDVQQRAREGRVPPGELHLHVPGTGEVHRVRVFDNLGTMRDDAVREVSWALRDRRTGRARTVEPRLITMLYVIGQWYDAPLEVVSGYRVRGLNASDGSRHGGALACDFRIADVGVRQLTQYVERTFADVGVGYYPTSAFVHLDVRRPSYFWIDRSAPGQRSRTRSRSVEVRADRATDVTLRSAHVTERELYVPPPFAE